MIESIVCSRAKVFAGTYFSTFTVQNTPRKAFLIAVLLTPLSKGYIHRLRGFHGLGEYTYYHSTQYVHSLQVSRLTIPPNLNRLLIDFLCRSRSLWVMASAESGELAGPTIEGGLSDTVCILLCDIIITLVYYMCLY